MSTEDVPLLRSDPVDTGALKVEAAVAEVAVLGGVLIRVDVEVAVGSVPVDTLVTGVTRVKVEAGRDSVLRALEDRVWFVNLRTNRAPYLSGGNGKPATENRISENKSSNKVTRP